MEKTFERSARCIPVGTLFPGSPACGIDKSTSLGALLSHLDITPEEIIVIGDGVCDVSMIQFAGLGIAMGNAQDSVKVCADVVTASNEEDGVALAVEKAILSEIRPAEIPLDQLNERARHALMGNLGIQYTYASEDRVEATMPVDERTVSLSAFCTEVPRCTGRDCCRTGFDDSLPARRDCGWYAGQR